MIAPVPATLHMLPGRPNDRPNEAPVPRDSLHDEFATILEKICFGRLRHPETEAPGVNDITNEAEPVNKTQTEPGKYDPDYDVCYEEGIFATPNPGALKESDEVGDRNRSAAEVQNPDEDNREKSEPVIQQASGQIYPPDKIPLAKSSGHEVDDVSVHSQDSKLRESNMNFADLSPAPQDRSLNETSAQEATGAANGARDFLPDLSSEWFPTTEPARSSALEPRIFTNLGPDLRAVLQRSLPPDLQITNIQTSHANSQEGGVEFSIESAELGRLHFALRDDGDTLRMLVAADRADTLDLLRRSAERLQEELRAAGYGHAEMSFEQSAEREEPPHRQPSASDEQQQFRQPLVMISSSTQATGLDIRF